MFEAAGISFRFIQILNSLYEIQYHTASNTEKTNHTAIIIRVHKPNL